MDDRDDGRQAGRLSDPVGQPRPTDTGSVRRYTSPHAVPVVAFDLPSRPMLAAEQGPALDPLDTRIDARFAAIFPAAFDAHLEEATRKRFRRLWAALVAAAGVSVGSLWAAARSALDDARAEGADKLRLHIIERDAERAAAEARATAERLRFEIDSLRSEFYYRPARRRDEPDPPDPGNWPRKHP
jgi:hypothetical protein